MLPLEQGIYMESFILIQILGSLDDFAQISTECYETVST